MPIPAAGGRDKASTTVGIPVAAVVAILIAGSAQAQPALGAAPGMGSASLTLPSVAARATHLTGTVQLLPEVTVTSPPVPYDFGAWEVGTSSSQQQFVIENTGTASLSIPSGGIHLSTDAGCAGFALFESTPHVDVSPGGTVTFNVQFIPVAAGIVSCTIEIESNDPNSPTTLTVSGEGLAPILEVTPDSIDFPVTLVEGVSATEEITIRNVGQLDMSVDDISLDDTTHFELTSAPVLPVTISPSMAETVGVRFTPFSPGPHTATVTVTTSNPVPPAAVFVDLSGEAVQPELYITPSVLDFEPAAVGETSSAGLTFDNPGGAELDVTSISIVGPDLGQFALVGPASFTVAAGATRPVAVDCTPTTIGLKVAALSVTSDAANVPSNPTLRCRGVGPDECAPTCAIFADGFESGDTSVWN